MKQFVIVTKLFLIFIICFSSCCDRPRPAVPMLPNSLSRLTLREVVKGVEANKIMYRMHGRLTGSRSNSIIGYYSFNTKKNVLYVTAFENNEQAENVLEKMVSKMKNTAFGFSPPTVVKTDDYTVYRTKGMGLAHFYFRSDNLLIWWQVELDNADTTFVAVQAHFSVKRQSSK